MIPWRKRGVIFAPDGTSPWMRSRAAPPVVEAIDDQQLRVYFSSCDDNGRARIGAIDVALSPAARLEHVHPEPLLPLGRPGTFDDNGMSPTCLVDVRGRKYLYYIGWNPQVTVSYRLAIGLAISDDGVTFSKVSEGPILDRDLDEPFFNTAPWVLHENGVWRMWYVSCTGWEEIDGRQEPRYHVKYAESPDGVRWRRTGRVCIDYDNATGAITRPCVVVEGGRYHMWTSYRDLVGYRTDPRASYRLGYAVSGDGLTWTRRDAEAGLERSADGWDSEMIAYAQVLRHRDHWYCFYNGNGFGRTGIGFAEHAA
jgi:hypothetical protein